MFLFEFNENNRLRVLDSLTYSDARSTTITANQTVRSLNNSFGYYHIRLNDRNCHLSLLHRQASTNTIWLIGQKVRQHNNNLPLWHTKLEISPIDLKIPNLLLRRLRPLTQPTKTTRHAIQNKLIRHLLHTLIAK